MSPPFFPPRTSPGPLANPYTQSKRSAIINEDANKTVIFSRDKEEAWNGYDSLLDDSDSDSNSNASPPPGEVSEKVLAASKASTWEQVQKSFHREDIKAHECQLKEDNYSPIDQQERVLKSSGRTQGKSSSPPGAPGLCDWAKAECCSNSGLPPLPCQRQGCPNVVHHLCQISWEMSHGMEEENISRWCLEHHRNFQEVEKIILADWQKEQKQISDAEVLEQIAQDFHNPGRGQTTSLSRAVAVNTALYGPSKIIPSEQDVDQYVEVWVSLGIEAKGGEREAMEAVVITNTKPPLDNVVAMEAVITPVTTGTMEVDDLSVHSLPLSVDEQMVEEVSPATRVLKEALTDPPEHSDPPIPQKVLGSAESEGEQGNGTGTVISTLVEGGKAVGQLGSMSAINPSTQPHSSPENEREPTAGSSPTGAKLPPPLLCTPNNRGIPLNQEALSAIRNTQEVLIFRNTRPQSTGDGVTFVSMQIYHKVYGEDPGANVYKCIRGAYELLLKADSDSSIQALYEDAATTPDPIVSLNKFPQDIMGLANYVQVSNAYTLSPAFGKDEEGNNKLQHPTYVYMRIKTRYLFSHVVGLIQPSLNILNISMKEKEMPYLDTKTRFALVGTTNEWCPSAIQQTLQKELEKHAESMNKGGILRGEYMNRDPPPFLIRKTKLKLPKLDVISKQDADFINYFERLRQCNVIEVADADWPWMKLLMENFALSGKLKRVVSRQASILELTHGIQSNFSNTRFLKGLHMQMSYNHFFRTTDIAGVISLDYPIRVEVENGYVVPFKKTTLRRELMCMQHPPDSDGNLGLMFIDGAHYVYTGPGRCRSPDSYHGQTVVSQAHRLRQNHSDVE